MFDPERLSRAYDTVRSALLAERNKQGHWVGELSSSALSTATATSALAIVCRHFETTSEGRLAERPDELRLFDLVAAGLQWLADRQNPDGGWGDTDRSLSNISTTMLVRAAFHLSGVPSDHAGMLERAQAYIATQGGIVGLRRRYGKDKTFAVPILTNCALAGLVPWRAVSALPFELACVPRSWFRFMRLPVVSYAIPALVAIGLARFHHLAPRNPLVRWVRRASVEKSLAILAEIQPASGGYLEATPLTSFVVMSLASSGLARHPVTLKGVEFLIRSARPDGAWPIDTNLATWLTTLSTQALASGMVSIGTSGENDTSPSVCRGDIGESSTESGFRGLKPTPRASIVQRQEPLPDSSRCEWLLGCQHSNVHPYTGAAAGGWGWSDLSGAVPDADDTAGALLALAIEWENDGHSTDLRRKILTAGAAGVRWLLGLQNRDGGWPTFCRGWGMMPFDRSGTDLTAHAIRAISAWNTILMEVGSNESPPWNEGSRVSAAIERGFAFLDRTQRDEGSWIPLWFGNQFDSDEENPVYGTAKVLAAYRDLGRSEHLLAQRAAKWLILAQNADGGWGGGGLPTNSANAGTMGHEKEKPKKAEAPFSSVEETALALEALLGRAQDRTTELAIEKGLECLVTMVERNHYRRASPIGLYFAKLWYYERVYPLIYATSTLGLAIRQSKIASRGNPPSPQSHPPLARSQPVPVEVPRLAQAPQVQP